jgi:hypothetical protein
MESFFLGLFYFGAIFTLITTVMGAIGGHGPDGGAHDVPMLKGVDTHHTGELTVPHGHEVPALKTLHPLMPYLSTSAIVTFMTWFGGAGYVLVHSAGWPWFFALLPAMVAGAAGASVVAAFIGWLRRGSKAMRKEDFTLHGTLARVAVEIPANGVGEIVFTMGGVRRSEAAKGLVNRALSQGSEVVITHYERGMATVEPLKELMDGSSESDRAAEVNASRIPEED